MKPVFGCFDHAYVLNVDGDNDRMERVSVRLQTLNVPFDRFPASRFASRLTQNDSSHVRFTKEYYACAASHAALLRLILERNHETALILEDDAVFRDDTAELMAWISTELASEPWDIFYMGLHLISSQGRVSKHLGRVGHGYHAHAYGVCGKAIPRLLKCIDQFFADPHDAYDRYADETLLKVYAIPILAIQEPNHSYSYNSYIDRLPQYFSVFDGDDFEQHCSEMQKWQSRWRQILIFVEIFRRAQQEYACGSVDEAFRQYLRALSTWPDFEAAVRREWGKLETFRSWDEYHTDDSDSVRACTSLSSIIRRVWTQMSVPLALCNGSAQRPLRFDPRPCAFPPPVLTDNEQEDEEHPESKSIESLAIVIPWSNRKELEFCLETNRDLFHKPGRQLVLVNGGGDLANLQTMVDRLRLGNTVIVHLDGVPFNKCWCLNLGVSVTREDTLLLLDADIIVTDSTLERAMLQLRGHTFITIQDGVETDPASHPQVLKASRCLLEKVITTEWLFTRGSKASIEFRQTLCGRSVAGLILVRKEHYLAVGGYNSQLEGWGFEDYDLQIRLQAQAGLQRVNVGTASHITHTVPDERAQHLNNLRNSARSFDNYNRGNFLGTYSYDLNRWRSQLKVYSLR